MSLSHPTLIDDQSISRNSSNTGRSNNIWKKNFEVDVIDNYLNYPSESEHHSLYSKSEHHSHNAKSDDKTTGRSLLSRQGQIVPAPKSEEMNRYFLQQQQRQQQQRHNEINESARNGNEAATSSLPSLNVNNNVASMLMQNSSLNTNHSHGHQQQGSNPSTVGGTPRSANSNSTVWLQHMILNPIHPLQNDLSSVSNNTVENRSGTMNNQMHINTGQHQVRGDSGRSAENNIFHQQQMSNQLGNVTLGASSITSSLSKFRSEGHHHHHHHQQQQQQQDLQLLLSPQQQEILPLGDIASQLQVPVSRQSQSQQLQQQLQQQQTATRNNSSQIAAFPTAVSDTSSQQQQQQQQQQLLLLALMLQPNNTNNSGSSIDTSALSSTLASPEGLRLVNSLLLGQQLPTIQDNQAQQQQVIHLPHNGGASSSSLQNSSSLSVDNLTTVQEDVLSNPQHFLSQQSQQAQSLSFLNPPQLDLSRPGNNGETSFFSSTMYSPSVAMVSASNRLGITNLSIPVDSPSVLAGSKTSDGKSLAYADRDSIGFAGSIENNKRNKGNKTPTVKARFPRLLYCESDDVILGEYQTLLRQQLELFEADSHDVINGTFRQGRTTPIRLGQIGLRCKHCAEAPLSSRTKGSVYFSQTIKGMYQIGQNMSKVHLCERCPRLPPDIKKRMITLRSRRHRASGGRAYWIRHLRDIDIYEDGTVLRVYQPGERKKAATAQQIRLQAKASSNFPTADSRSRKGG